MARRTFEVRLRFQAEDHEDALLALDGLDDSIESWDPPFWQEGEPVEVLPDEPEVVGRYAEGDPTAFGMAGRWTKLRVPFIGKESGAIIIERNSRNGLEVKAEVGHLCAERSAARSDRGGHFVSGPVLGLIQGTDALGVSEACCGQHAAFRHLLTIPRHLATVLDLEQREGKFGSFQIYFDIVDEPEGHIRIFNRHAYEDRLQREGRRAGARFAEKVRAHAASHGADCAFNNPGGAR